MEIKHAPKARSRDICIGDAVSSSAEKVLQFAPGEVLGQIVDGDAKFSACNIGRGMIGV